jgi:hypothetical protein
MIDGLHGALELPPHILRSELDLERGRAALGVTHEPHEGWKRDAGQNLIGAERVSEAMGIGF